MAELQPDGSLSRDAGGCSVILRKFRRPKAARRPLPPNRVPKGISSSGQFAKQRHDEADTRLGQVVPLAELRTQAAASLTRAGELLDSPIFKTAARTVDQFPSRDFDELSFRVQRLRSHLTGSTPGAGLSLLDDDSFTPGEIDPKELRLTARHMMHRVRSHLDNNVMRECFAADAALQPEEAKEMLYRLTVVEARIISISARWAGDQPAPEMWAIGKPGFGSRSAELLERAQERRSLQRGTATHDVAPSTLASDDPAVIG